jgi:hypothetical protein
MSLLDGSQGNSRAHTAAREHALIEQGRLNDTAHSAPHQDKYCRSSLLRPRRKSAGAVLFPVPPLRLEQPEDLYVDVPSCWWSRHRWVAYTMALYDLLYAELRATLRAPSVKRDTFLAWAIAESGCADLGTGRECRPSVRYLSQRIRRNRRTVQPATHAAVGHPSRR